jgi:TetR/AcrR family transcriptional regulator, regulator of cefoperazone and chloramphenicol sensitivity
MGLPVLSSDLTPYARIRNAALEGFAARGIEATSIRDVAAMAGVSPGLVQHHFGTKAGLREAVDEYVVEVAAETFEGLVDGAEGWPAMGDRVTAWVRDNVLALRYLARGLMEGDAQAVQIFGDVVELVRSNGVQALARSGALDPGVDQDWAAMHVVIFNLACVLLEPAISRHLAEPFFSDEQLERWNRATTELYRRGVAGGTAVRRGRRRK